MAKDEFYTGFKDISDIPSSILQRLKHYFLTYKNMPGIEEHVCEIVQVYGREEALKVIELGMEDYKIEILKK
jgi:inorganic pyrophosphatase